MAAYNSPDLTARLEWPSEIPGVLLVSVTQISLLAAHF